MNANDFRISRWVMLVETLGCFGPMTLGWYEITFGASGLVRHDWNVVTKYYLPFPGGSYIFAMVVLGAIVGLAGPLGLWLGSRVVATGRALNSRAVGYTLFAAPLVYGVAGFAGLFLGPPDFRPDPAMTILFVLMPAAGIAHLMFLARPAPPPLAGGGLAAA